VPPTSSTPLLQKRDEVKNSLLLVITSNRGLCGGYNASILREAMQASRRIKDAGVGLNLELSGKRGIAFFRFHRLEAAATYTHFEEKPSFDEVEVLANKYLSAYISGKVDRVEVAYMKFVNASKQTAVVETLLPLTSAEPEIRKPRTQVQPTAPVEYDTCRMQPTSWKSCCRSPSKSACSSAS